MMSEFFEILEVVSQCSAEVVFSRQALAGTDHVQNTLRVRPTFEHFSQKLSGAEAPMESLLSSSNIEALQMLIEVAREPGETSVSTRRQHRAVGAYEGLMSSV
jgi:hypothetical protein